MRNAAVRAPEGNKVELSPKQGQWMLKARKIASEVLSPRAERVDREGLFPRENLMLLGKEGILALPIPAAKGGEGADIVTVALVLAELAKGCASTAMSAHMHLSTVPLVAALANDRQEERLLGPILRGEWLGAIAMSEVGSGSRVWHSDGYAERFEGGYRITASKSFVTNVGEADYYVIPVRKSRESTADDMSLFVAEKTLRPIQPLVPWDAMGFRGSVSGPVKFENFEVPEDALLGEPGSGFPMIVCFNFPLYHVGLAAIYIGIAEAAMDDAIRHVKGRIHADTGASLGSVETVQRYVGEMRVHVSQARALLIRVSKLVDRALKVMTELAGVGVLSEIVDNVLREDDFFLEVAALKAAATGCATAVSDAALQICGGAGYKRGHPAERHYRNARAGGLMAPNDDALKILVGKQLLGHPFPWDEGKPLRRRA